MQHTRKLRVIVLLDNKSSRDMDERTRFTVSRHTAGSLISPLPGYALYRYNPAQPGPQLIRSVAALDAESACIHRLSARVHPCEIHTTGDHMVTTALPEEAQTRPKFWGYRIAPTDYRL